MKAAWRTLPGALLLACVSIIAGTLNAGLLIGWHALNPLNVDWLHGDPAVYQAGWEFLRHQGWKFPLTWIDNIDYPFGISASYLDVIPIVAIPLRLLSNALPTDFQYLVVCATLCCVLQFILDLS
jgi:hypothetical protein